jgi:polygalacturonase
MAEERESYERRHLFGLVARTAFAGAALAQTAPAQETRMPDGRLIFSVRQFGAAGDGKTKDTAAIQRAIDASSAARGGIVYFPPGEYLTGSVVLKDHVTLYLESGATLVGSRDLSDWTSFPAPGGAPGGRGGRHLIYAEKAVNVGIMGAGRINGSADAFYRKRTEAEHPGDYQGRMEGGRVAAFWSVPLARPNTLIAFRECTGVRLYDVLLTSTCNWTFRPIMCDGVFVRGVTLRTPLEVPNSDGIDPDGCTNVLISDCNISTGDDGICLKNNISGRMSRNITVTNCTVETTCNGLKIDEARGDGGFENITFSNCVIHCAESPDQNRAISGIHIDSGYDGGRVAGVVISNISMYQVRSPIFIRSTARTRGRGPAPGANAPPVSLKYGVIRDIMINNVFATGQTITNSITGLPDHDLENISLSDIHIAAKERGSSELARKQVPELPEDYPEASMFSRVSSYGLYCRHIKGLKLRSIEFELLEPDMRPALICDDVKNLDVNSFAYATPGSGEPGIRLIGVKRAFIQSCVAPPDSATFLQVEGKDTGKITVIGNDLSEAAKGVSIADGVPAGVVFEAANRPAKS